MDEGVYRAHADMEDAHWWFVARRQLILDVLGTVLPVGNQPFVIDVGCGTGGTVAAFRAAGFDALGLDASALAINIANSKYPEATYRCGRMPDDLIDCIDRADAVTLLDVIEHIEDDNGFLKTLVDILPVGSHLMITVPAMRALWSPHDVANHHFRRYEKPDLAALWSDLPVTCRMISYFNAHLYPVVRAARMVTKLVGSAAGEGGSDFSLPPAPLNTALRSIFAAEGTRLRASVDRSDGGGFGVGSSLMAVLRREATP